MCIIDREGRWEKGNWVMVTSVHWAIAQPELLILGALEYFQVVATSHITGRPRTSFSAAS
jgi:hypothetical protein